MDVEPNLIQINSAIAYELDTCDHKYLSMWSLLMWFTYFVIKLEEEPHSIISRGSSDVFVCIL